MNPADFSKFLIHKFFTSFSLGIFFSYGALLIYAKFDSVELVLWHALIGTFGYVLTFTWALPLILKPINRLGLRRSMMVGMVAMAAVDVFLFSLPAQSQLLLAGVLAASIVRVVVASFYYLPYNAMNFLFIGNGLLPGRNSSFMTMVGIVSGLAGTLVALVFNVGDRFIYLFLLSALSLICGALVLRKIEIPRLIYKAKFPNYLKYVSRGAFWAYSEVALEMQNTILPIVVLFAVGTLSKSVLITALSALGAVAGAYFAGKAKDSGRQKVILWSGIILVAGWAGYVVASSPWHFIALGIVLGVCGKIVSTAQNARFGRDTANSNLGFEIVFPIELSKALSRFLAVAIGLVAFRWLGTIPVAILVLAGISLVPRVVFSLGGIATRNSLVDQETPIRPS